MIYLSISPESCQLNPQSCSDVGPPPESFSHSTERSRPHWPTPNALLTAETPKEISDQRIESGGISKSQPRDFGNLTNQAKTNSRGEFP